MIAAAAAGAFPAAAAAAHTHRVSPLAFGWGVVIGALLLALRWFVRLLKGGKK